LKKKKKKIISREETAALQATAKTIDLSFSITCHFVDFQVSKYSTTFPHLFLKFRNVIVPLALLHGI
jgi:hypothetical protein